MLRLIFLSFIYSCAIYAVPIGNLASPSLLQEGYVIKDTSPINLRGELEQCFINNERLRFRSEYNELGFADLKIKGLYRSGVGIINIKEQVDIYVKCGPLCLIPEFQQADSWYLLKSKNTLFYQGGMKAVIIEVKDLTFSMDGKYIFYRSKAQCFLQDQSPISVNKIRFHLQGWQLAGGAAYKIGLLVPYFGLVCGDIKMHLKHTPFFEDKSLKMKQRHKGGMFIGASITNGSYFLLNGEFRFINERTITLSGAVRF